MLSTQEFIDMLNSAADSIIGAENELTEIDAKFGDADHGITMTKVMKNVKKTLSEAKTTTSFKALLDDVFMAIMSINGGSAVPLWSTLFEGMSEGAPDSQEINESELKNIFKVGYETLFALSKANIGDKTMMDTLIPAVKAIISTEGDIKTIMTAGENAAIAGAEASKNFISKFGRAKSYKEQTIGTPDAGAVSMKYFFIGLNKAI